MAKRKTSTSSAEQKRRRSQADASAKPFIGSFPERGRLGLFFMGLCMDPLPSEIAGIKLENDDNPEVGAQ